MRNHNESKLQQSCVKYFDLQYPHLKLNLFSIPNEGARTVANGARMKAQGRRAGVADMFFAKRCDGKFQKVIGSVSWYGKSYNGLFIEFKYGKGTQNDNQKEFQKSVTSQGYRYEVITDFDQFKNLITEYLE